MCVSLSITETLSVFTSVSQRLCACLLCWWATHRGRQDTSVYETHAWHCDKMHKTCCQGDFNIPTLKSTLVIKGQSWKPSVWPALRRLSFTIDEGKIRVLCSISVSESDYSLLLFEESTMCPSEERARRAGVFPQTLLIRGSHVGAQLKAFHLFPYFPLNWSNLTFHDFHFSVGSSRFTITVY